MSAGRLRRGALRAWYLLVLLSPGLLLLAVIVLCYALGIPSDDYWEKP